MILTGTNFNKLIKQFLISNLFKFQIIEFIEKMASSHKQEIVVAGENIEEWMKVC